MKPVAASVVAVLIIGILGGSCGCTHPVKLDLAPPAASRTLPIGSSKAHPALFLGEVTDGRISKDSLGQMGGRSVEAGDLAQAFAAHVARALAKGWTLTGTKDSADPELRVEILKAYVDSVDVSRTAVVVARFSVITPERTVFRVVRGQYAAMNWWNSGAEAQAAFEHAMERCAAQAATLLPGLFRELETSPVGIPQAAASPS
jgi:hypothetical protein